MAIVTREHTAGAGTASAGAVTLNYLTGVVTTEALTTAAGSFYDLVITNSKAVAGDIVLASVLKTTAGGLPVVGSIQPAGGTIGIRIHNIHAAAAFDGALLISYIICKAT